MRDTDHLTGSAPVEGPDRTANPPDGEPQSSSGVLVDALPPNARIVVTTMHSRYRFDVLDGADRRVRITGGKLFPDATEMLLEGATTDVGTIKPGWISVGLRVALSTGLRRIVTSRVESVVFERVPASVRAA
jgi:hypothetical protein